jgi:hypothetical protein
MSLPEPLDLLRALAATGRASQAWTKTVQAAVEQKPPLSEVLPLWQERLALLHLAIIRTSARLHAFAELPPGVYGQQESPQRDSAQYQKVKDQTIVGLRQWMDAQDIDPWLQRLDRIREAGAQCVNAEIIDDIATITALAQQTVDILKDLDDHRSRTHLMDLAFFQVLSPWHVKGLTPLHLTTRWLEEYALEHGPW